MFAQGVAGYQQCNNYHWEGQGIPSRHCDVPESRLKSPVTLLAFASFEGGLSWWPTLCDSFVGSVPRGRECRCIHAEIDCVVPFVRRAVLFNHARVIKTDWPFMTEAPTLVPSGQSLLAVYFLHPSPSWVHQKIICMRNSKLNQKYLLIKVVSG